MDSEVSIREIANIKAAADELNPAAVDDAQAVAARRAAFEARIAALAAPAGCVVVPREPTEAMLDAAMLREDDEPPSDWGKIRNAPHEAIYAAMLAAAPKVSEQADPAPAVAAGHVETLRKVIGLLRDTRTLQGREHISTGIAFNDAIDYFADHARIVAAKDQSIIELIALARKGLTLEEAAEQRAEALAGVLQEFLDNREHRYAFTKLADLCNRAEVLLTGQATPEGAS